MFGQFDLLITLKITELLLLLLVMLPFRSKNKEIEKKEQLRKKNAFFKYLFGIFEVNMKKNARKREREK